MSLNHNKKLPPKSNHNTHGVYKAHLYFIYTHCAYLLKLLVKCGASILCQESILKNWISGNSALISSFLCLLGMELDKGNEYQDHMN